MLNPRPCRPLCRTGVFTAAFSGAGPAFSVNPRLGGVMVSRDGKDGAPLESIPVENVIVVKANLFRRLVIHLLAAGWATIKPSFLYCPRRRHFFALAGHVYAPGWMTCSAVAMARSSGVRAMSARTEPWFGLAGAVTPGVRGLFLSAGTIFAPRLRRRAA
jgi:hypothetical protein